MFFIDLDDFKLVNDTLGHHCGDQVLVEVGRRLAASVRPGDTAARLGGDEFAVLVEGLSGPAEAQEVGRRLVERLHERFVVEGTEVVVTATVGIAVAASGTSTDAVLREADLAMYEAKRQGKDRAEPFAEDMRSPALHRRSLKADISRGLERGEFVTHYQPIVDLETGRFVAVEALVRWDHPERGLLGPGEFISVAEDTGLVVPIGLEVLHRAVEQTQEWNQRYCLEPPLRVSVNLSGRQVQAHGLVRDVARALDSAGMEPEQLTLEITESVLLEDAGPAGDALGDLKALGVALSLDDFGTGYSSLGYLQRFPIDELKLDRMFVRGHGCGSHDTRLAGAIIALGQMLGLQVVAEGIEGPEQLETLRRLGCRRGQGYHFSPPLTAAALHGLLASGAAGPLAGENPDGVGAVTTSR